MDVHIEKSSKERIVIIGGGFGGLKIAKNLSNSNYQVVLIDRNNYHQFQPLFYQVATSGLEPSSIIFPFRKMFQKKRDVYFRMAEVHRIETESKVIQTSIGDLDYDHLIIATGAGNNFFGNKNIEKYALPMKSINESLRLRNIILERFEESLNLAGEALESCLTIVIAGAGPTGVELAGTLAEMKRNILPKDYPELDFSLMKIIVVEGSPRVLSVMSEKTSSKAESYLKKMGVVVNTNTRVEDYDGEKISLVGGSVIHTKTLIWAAGVKANFMEGLPDEAKTNGNRIQVNEFNQVSGVEGVYAIGDVALMTSDPEYPNGHPQLAQVAIQQGTLLSKNFKNKTLGKLMHGFVYKNLGTMATIGRNKAVVELPKYKFYGFFAWIVWMLVHLRSILGVKNKFIVFVNWVWNYFTYNLSLRLIIKRNDK